MPESLNDFAKRVVAARAAQNNARNSSEPMAPAWEFAGDFGEKHQLSPEARANFEAYVTRARNSAEMFAAPKVFWASNNIPGVEWARRAFEKMSRRGEEPRYIEPD